MKKLLLILLGIAVFSPEMALAEKCVYQVDPGSLQVNWTAFKTMQKVAVKGGFTELTVFGDLESASLAGLLDQLEAEIDIKNEGLIRTGNPGRDLTLFQHFFSLFKARPLMKGRIQKTRGSESDGDFTLELVMNRKTRTVPMKYSYGAGVFEASGSIDVLEFALDGPLKELNRTCEALHRGPDGVSKTWPTVDLRLVARIGKSCTP